MPAPTRPIPLLFAIPIAVAVVQGLLVTAVFRESTFWLIFAIIPLGYPLALLPALRFSGLPLGRVLIWTVLYAVIGQAFQLMVLVGTGVIAPCHGHEPTVATQALLIVPPTLITAGLHGYMTRSAAVGLLTTLLPAAPSLGLGLLASSIKGVSSGDVIAVNLLGNPINPFHATIWTLIAALILATWSRRHPAPAKDHCTCGYPRTGLRPADKCPECGHKSLERKLEE